MKKVNSKQNPPDIQRKIVELSTLNEVASALNSSLDLEVTLRTILKILNKRMGMERGTIALIDAPGDAVNIKATHGLDLEAEKRGSYKVGEGITGRVVKAGEPIVVPNVGKEPLFLNRTKSRSNIKKSNTSFICVPIKVGSRTVGTLSADRLFQEENISLDEDVRLLTTISSFIAQSVKLVQLVEIEKEKLRDENKRLQTELKERFQPKNMVGKSGKMQEVFKQIKLVADSNATVIIRGESGTGKEQVARAIHFASPRADKPFIKVACAALPESLLESELFGYEKGAFTGAQNSKPGRFELANGGTLFLDEIGDITPATQVKLLRVIQEREFERVGGIETIKVNIRILVATHRNLEEEVRRGKFREDLYYRLNVLPLFAPPLRDRREDIPLLAEYFLDKFLRENEKEGIKISDSAWEHLLNYPWPGNVRELENAIERAVVLCRGKEIDESYFQLDVQDRIHDIPELNLDSLSFRIDTDNLEDAVSSLERKMIKQALADTKGNKRKAAGKLGVTERIMGYKIKKYGL